MQTFAAAGARGGHAPGIVGVQRSLVQGEHRDERDVGKHDPRHCDRVGEFLRLAHEARGRELNQERHVEINHPEQDDLRQDQEGEDLTGEMAGLLAPLGLFEYSCVGRQIGGIERAFAENLAELVRQLDRRHIRVVEGATAKQGSQRTCRGKSRSGGRRQSTPPTEKYFAPCPACPMALAGFGHLRQSGEIGDGSGGPKPSVGHLTGRAAPPGLPHSRTLPSGRCGLAAAPGGGPPRPKLRPRALAKGRHGRWAGPPAAPGPLSPIRLALGPGRPLGALRPRRAARRLLLRRPLLHRLRLGRLPLLRRSLLHRPLLRLGRLTPAPHCSAAGPVLFRTGRAASRSDWPSAARGASRLAASFPAAPSLRRSAPVPREARPNPRPSPARPPAP